MTPQIQKIEYRQSPQPLISYVPLQGFEIIILILMCKHNKHIKIFNFSKTFIKKNKLKKI